MSSRPSASRSRIGRSSTMSNATRRSPRRATSISTRTLQSCVHSDSTYSNARTAGSSESWNASLLKLAVPAGMSEDALGLRTAPGSIARLGRLVVRVTVDTMVAAAGGWFHGRVRDVVFVGHDGSFVADFALESVRDLPASLRADLRACQ